MQCYRSRERGINCDIGEVLDSSTKNYDRSPVVADYRVRDYGPPKCAKTTDYQTTARQKNQGDGDYGLQP